MAQGGRMITIYGIANCDKCRRACRWLAAQKLAWQFHDFKRAGVPQDELARWLAAEPQLVNRRGTTWRRLTAAQQALLEDDASAPKAQALLCAQASLLKRPIVAKDGQLWFGWDEQVQAALLA